jgi:hypothetical protein
MSMGWGGIPADGSDACVAPPTAAFPMGAVAGSTFDPAYPGAIQALVMRPTIKAIVSLARGFRRTILNILGMLSASVAMAIPISQKNPLTYCS